MLEGRCGGEVGTGRVKYCEVPESGVVGVLRSDGLQGGRHGGAGVVRLSSARRWERRGQHIGRGFAGIWGCTARKKVGYTNKR